MKKLLLTLTTIVILIITAGFIIPVEETEYRIVDRDNGQILFVGTREECRARVKSYELSEHYGEPVILAEYEEYVG